MRIVISLLLSVVLISTLACCKEEPTPKPPSGPEKLEVLWRTPLVENDFSRISSINPVIYEDIVVFSSDKTVNGINAPVVFLDSATGLVQDYWTDYSDGPFSYADEAMAYEGKYLFLGGQRSVDCIDMETRQTRWQGPAGDNTPYLYVNNGYLYRGVQYDGQNPTSNRAAIMRTPVDSRNWDTVYAFKRTDSFRPGFGSMGFGRLSNGDEVVVWKNRSFTGSSNRTDIFAFNLTADTLLWRNMDFVEASGIIPLKVENGVVYGLLRYLAVAVDLATGNTLWTQDFSSVNTTLDQQYYSGDFHLEGNRMIVKGQSDEVIALDITNGDIAWVEQDLPFGVSDRFTYFEGKLFLSGSNNLMAIDVQTGKNVLDPARTEHLDDVNGRISIDPSRRVMYMNNGREALCVKIPDDI